MNTRKRCHKYFKRLNMNDFCFFYLGTTNFINDDDDDSHTKNNKNINLKFITLFFFWTRVNSKSIIIITTNEREKGNNRRNSFSCTSYTWDYGPTKIVNSVCSYDIRYLSFFICLCTLMHENNPDRIKTCRLDLFRLLFTETVNKMQRQREGEMERQ